MLVEPIASVAPGPSGIGECIERSIIGPNMGESNFPVDKVGAGHVVLWNAFERIAADCSADEKRDLFHDTAARAYRIPTLA